MNFQVQVRFKKPDNTESIKSWSFKGLFDAQARSLGLFDKLVKSLRPDAIEKESFLIWVLCDGKCISEYKSKQWIEKNLI